VTVTCIGIETVLDWLYVPAITLGNEEPNTAIQRLISSAIGNVGPVNWSAASASSSASTPTNPVGIVHTGWFSTGFTTTGGSLRQVLTDYLRYNAASITYFGHPPASWVPYVDMDFNGGIRVAAAIPSEFTTLTLDTAGANKPSNTEWGASASGAVHQVAVTGGAVPFPVSDGTGKVGPVARVSAVTSADAYGAYLDGQQYLADNGVATDGTVMWEGAAIGSIGAERRPGMTVTIRDPGVGIASLTGYIVDSIDKAFAASGEETWKLTFGGGQPKTGSVYLRALTRASLI
jgi:hypothetical protein